MLTNFPARYTQFSTLSKSDSAAVSIVKYLGRDHLRVPVVMLVGDKVINPVGSKGPEFVPVSVLSSLGWNGRPVIPIHPNMTSANIPDVIDQMGFGTIFHSQVKNNKLGCEVYLDMARAEELKLNNSDNPAISSASGVIKNCQSGEMIEVSTGCFVVVREESGIAADGTPYEYVWESIVEPDHLAMGLSGGTGACSVDNHGCGAPRMLKLQPSTMPNKTLFFLDRSLASGMSDIDLRDLIRAALLAVTPGAKYVWPEAIYSKSVIYSVSYDSTPEKLFERSYTLSGTKIDLLDDIQEVVIKRTYEPKLKESSVSDPDKKNIGFVARLSKMVDWFRANEDISDSDLRTKLQTALSSVEAGYPWVKEVYQSTGIVIYTIELANYVERWYQRTFILDTTSGDISLNDDRAEVVRKEPAVVYEIVTNESAASGQLKVNESVTCSCKYNHDRNKGDVTVAEHARKAQIDKLIVAGDFKETERAILENMSEKKFKMLAEMNETAETEEKKDKSKSVDPVTPVSDTSVVSVPTEIYQQMKQASDAFHVAEKTKKDARVAEVIRLQGENPVWNKTDLDAMPLVEVEKVHKVLSARQNVTNTGNTGNSNSPSLLGMNPSSVTVVDDSKVDAMPSVSQRILENKEIKTKTVRGSGEIVANPTN